MKIVIVSTYYSEGMGYAENCLPKALALLGHEVHVLASNWNIYGNLPGYNESYKSFLGPAEQEPGKYSIDGYTLHRMPSSTLGGYVYIKGLYSKLKELSPDIVHSMEIASIQTYILSFIKPLFKFVLFTETHQHLSVIKPYLKTSGSLIKKLFYKLTRTLPTFLASFSIKVCYAISPDCAYVANVFYGVPKRKIKIQSLGTDTMLFHPVRSESDYTRRNTMRDELGYNEDDIVCIYTGRFSNDKNPLLLAKAISRLGLTHNFCKGLFIGDGIQKDEIKEIKNITILPFMKHKLLSEYFRAVDIAVWPTQESMSMLDAAASGLPLIVSDKIGEIDRINGNGKVFKEDNDEELSNAILGLGNKNTRISFGTIGRQKMEEQYSWEKIAKNIEADYFLYSADKKNL